MKDKTVFIIMMLCFVVLFTSVILCTVYENIAKDSACENIGFKSVTYYNDQVCCEDNNYNLHYVKMIPNGFKYIAKEISIGDVRVR